MGVLSTSQTLKVKCRKAISCCIWSQVLWCQPAALPFPPRTGARVPSWRILKDERKTNRQGCDTSSANEGLAHASPVPVAGEGLPCLEMSQELPFLGTGASFARAEGRASGVGRLLVRAHMDNSVEPQVLAVVPLPSDAEHRREILLARLIGHHPCR